MFDVDRVGRIHDVDLHQKVVAQEFGRVSAVRVDAADARGCIDDDLWPMLLEKSKNSCSVAQIEFTRRRSDEVGETLRLQVAPDCTADKTPVSGDEDARRTVEDSGGWRSRFVHLLNWLP